MSDPAAAATTVLPIGHAADLVLVVAEIPLLWKAVEAWTGFFRELNAVKIPPNGPLPCDIPPTVTYKDSAFNFCRGDGWDGAAGNLRYYFKPICQTCISHGGISGYRIFGWTVTVKNRETGRDVGLCNYPTDPTAGGHMNVTDNGPCPTS